MCLPFVWIEIFFLWVRWIIIAPKILPKTSDEFTTAIKLSAICKRLGLGLLKLNIFWKEKDFSLSVSHVSVRQLREALAVLKGQWFSLKGWFSVGTLKFQNPETPEMTYSLKKQLHLVLSWQS